MKPLLRILILEMMNIRLIYLKVSFLTFKEACLILKKLWALAFGFVGPKVTARQLLSEEKWTVAIVNNDAKP